MKDDSAALKKIMGKDNVERTMMKAKRIGAAVLVMMFDHQIPITRILDQGRNNL